MVIYISGVKKIMNKLMCNIEKWREGICYKEKNNKFIYNIFICVKYCYKC